MTLFQTVLLMVAISLIVTNAYLVITDDPTPASSMLPICRTLTAEEAKGLSAEVKWEECKIIRIIK